MDYNEIINKYKADCQRLATLKDNKVVEFNATVKADLKDLLTKEIITRDEVEEYLVSLKRALTDKEHEMNLQIEKEINNAKQEALNNINALLNSQNYKNSVSLTDAVMEESLEYIEELLASKEIKPEQKDPITERLSKAMPAHTYTRNAEGNTTYSNEQVTAQAYRQPEEVPVVKAPEPIPTPTPVPEVAQVTQPTPEPTVFAEQPVVKAPEPANEEPKVSTVELEKMLAEFDNLV